MLLISFDTFLRLLGCVLLLRFTSVLVLLSSSAVSHGNHPKPHWNKFIGGVAAVLHGDFAGNAQERARASARLCIYIYRLYIYILLYIIYIIIHILCINIYKCIYIYIWSAAPLGPTFVHPYDIIALNESYLMNANMQNTL